MLFYNDWAAIVPMANESKDFAEFVGVFALPARPAGQRQALLRHRPGDQGRHAGAFPGLSARDPRFVTVWAPENRNVVDAYMRGLREAYEAGHELIIEMDAGLSHDPRAIPMFLRVLNEGNECAFGSRFCNGGSMADSGLFRKTLSRTGTLLSNTLLGTDMFDMTSGFQGFHRAVVGEVLAYPLLSKAHFYQTEMRYLLRKKRFAEIPIHYRAPSNSVSNNAIRNALEVLWHYFLKRASFQAVHL